MALLRRWYGAPPWHLLLMVAVFAVVAYAGVRLLAGGSPWGIAVWFAGAALLHDLVLVPAYSLADRLLRTACLGRSARPDGTRGEPGRARTALLDHVRVPAVASALLLLVYLPLILGPPEAYVSKTGLTGEPFGPRWLGVCAVLFAASAALGAVRYARAVRAARTP
ncbi:hypothetical protein [Nocardiopsis sp. CA-288880]|uniref:hypothetical protein n=1 Tax=Nocardiopsis sp. CA-288880 TaxID=3239995 RepID=UPI003D972A34